MTTITEKIGSEVSHIIDKKLSVYKDISCYPSEEPNSISISKDFIESFKEVAKEKNSEFSIYHIKLIDELLKYYKKEDISIWNHSYKRKFIPEKDKSLKNFKCNDIYDICEPVSLIESEIHVPYKSKDFYFNILYLFDEVTTPFPRIQFDVLWKSEYLHYDYNYNYNYN